ncbi:MAG: copper homeostasis protein CutC, partial [Candidatus Bathyarchaeota archaeon]
RGIVMPGAGLEPENIAGFHSKAGAKEYHSTLWNRVESKMVYRKSEVYMGGLPEIPEFSWMQTNVEKIRAFLSKLENGVG